ncbi:MAG: hypothetical protein J7M08_03850 [Planctomycetes bacterium]|nr:hypothetical protein [Planctomycetota bacterium]
MTICQRQSGGRILCIRLSGLGDVVHTLNALTLLRRERPNAEISWIVEDRFSGLLRGHPCIDELITVPRKRWGEALKNPLRWQGLASEQKALWKRLRRRKFDASVDFQSSLKSAWLVAAAGAPLRIGFAGPISREFNHLVQNHLVRLPGKGVHRIERNLALLAPLGIATRYAPPLLPSAPPPRPWQAGAQIDEALPPKLTGGPLVLIHPGTSRFAALKRWIPSRYARVGDSLVQSHGADVLVSYGPDDRALAEEIVSLMKRRGALAPPTRDLTELICLLRRADLLIAPDTGPMHLASALGVPVVALFGPKDPIQTGPYCSRSLVVTGRAPCRPCTRRRCPDPVCMSSISGGQVLRAARQTLAGEGTDRSVEEPIPAGFTRAFRLGPWKGRIDTAYSSPEFFTYLCRADTEGTLPDAEGGDRFIVESRGAVRRAWRAAQRLSRPGLPALRPVCYMERRHGSKHDQILLLKRPAGAVPLSQWLRSHGGDDARDTRRQMLHGLASALRRIHAAGYCLGDPRLRNVFVADSARAQSAEIDVRLLARGSLHRIGWLPSVAGALVCGSELGKLSACLKRAMGEHDAQQFLRDYLQGGTLGHYARRLFKLAFHWREETDS